MSFHFTILVNICMFDCLELGFCFEDLRNNVSIWLYSSSQLCKRSILYWICSILKQSIFAWASRHFSHDSRLNAGGHKLGSLARSPHCIMNFAFIRSYTFAIPKVASIHHSAILLILYKYGKGIQRHWRRNTTAENIQNTSRYEMMPMAGISA